MDFAELAAQAGGFLYFHRQNLEKPSSINISIVSDSGILETDPPIAAIDIVKAIEDISTDEEDSKNVKALCSKFPHLKLWQIQAALTWFVVRYGEDDFEF